MSRLMALIIEEPESCKGCKLRYLRPWRAGNPCMCDDICAGTGKLVSAAVDTESRAASCPLVPVSDKDPGHNLDFDEWADGYTAGWNAFRKALVEENPEEEEEGKDE